MVCIQLVPIKGLTVTVSTLFKKFVYNSLETAFYRSFLHKKIFVANVKIFVCLLLLMHQLSIVIVYCIFIHKSVQYTYYIPYVPIWNREDFENIKINMISCFNFFINRYTNRKCCPSMSFYLVKKTCMWSWLNRRDWIEGREKGGKFYYY